MRACSLQCMCMYMTQMSSSSGEGSSSAGGDTMSVYKSELVCISSELM